MRFALSAGQTSLSLVRGEEIDDTTLVDYSTTHSTPDRQVYVSLHGEESALGS